MPHRFPCLCFWVMLFFSSNTVLGMETGPESIGMCLISKPNRTEIRADFVFRGRCCCWRDLQYLRWKRCSEAFQDSGQVGGRTWLAAPSFWAVRVCFWGGWDLHPLLELKAPAARQSENFVSILHIWLFLLGASSHLSQDSGCIAERETWGCRYTC